MKKILILVCLITSIFLVACEKGPGEYDQFAQCLTENDATMYGTEWCSHCKNQKASFGSSFEYIYFVDCDRDKDECLKAGVSGYPTWQIDGENYPGDQSLGRLASLTGCKLPG
jgi:hypothetical protein